MDLKKKLDYYRRSTAESTNKQTPKAVVQRSASLEALRAHFNGEIIGDGAPILKVHHQEAQNWAEDVVFLHRLSKGQFPEPIPLEQCLFFDLETTGLTGGAGTYPFLFGFGFFEKDQFVVVQYFLPDFGRDYYVFKQIKPLLEQKAILISFNGKSYDFPLLKTRAILNRIEVDLEKFKHLDLLHLVRRIWRDSQQSCDLVSIERQQLQVQRQGDIASHFIPSAYLRFIQSGVVHDMISTIRHNQIDIISLKKILFQLSLINQSPEVLSDRQALMRLAKLAFEINDYPYFLRIETQLLKNQNETINELQLWKSFFYKRQKNWPQACQLWENLIDHPAYSFLALEELAKVHEHVFKNHHKALQYSERALKIFSTLEQLNPYSLKMEVKEAFLQRRRRLKNKIS